MRRITLIGILALACFVILWLALKPQQPTRAPAIATLHPPEGRRTSWFDDAEILRETEHGLETPARSKRTTLLRRDARYPLVRVVETLETDPDTGSKTVVADSAVIADHFMVTLRDDVAEKDFRNFNATHGTRIRRKMYSPNMYLVEIPSPDPDSLDRMVDVYNAESSLFAGAEPDYLIELFGTTPNDPKYPADLWGIDKIQCPSAWDTNTGGGEVVVAVIDSGAQLDHEDLVANIWSNPNEVAGNSLDDDQNGFTNDVHGWDFAYGDNDPTDTVVGHGTRVAGVVGAVGNNSTGVVGVCWDVKIMVVRAFDDSENSSFSAIIQSLDYIRDMRTNGVNVRVTNASWGTPTFSEALSNAVARQRQADILCVASAGNYNENSDTSPRYPAAFSLDNVIFVLGTTTAANPVSTVMTTSRVAEAVYLPEDQDEDGDDMSDWWERFFFGSTNRAACSRW